MPAPTPVPTFTKTKSSTLLASPARCSPIAIVFTSLSTTTFTPK